MESGFDTYMNSGYNFDRLPKKTLLIRWHSSGSDQKTIDLTLIEPFKIDTLCDVYLDNFTTHHTSKSTPTNSMETSAFVLNINEFKIKTNIASNISANMSPCFDNIIIPADAISARTNDNFTRTHKSKKMNYICSINPTTITKITGKITGLDGTTAMFTNSSDDMFLAEFVFVARK